MDTEKKIRTTTFKAPKQVEYAVNIVVSTVMLVVFNNLLAWDVLPFVTTEFQNVLWIINISVAATIAVNAIFLFFSPDWFTALMRFFLNVVGLRVALTMLRVFPFDFSAYAFPWASWTRAILIISIVGVSIGIVTELVRFIVAIVKRK